MNARELLPVEKYLIGCVLPPHLSPFSDNQRDQTYIPPEERALMDLDFRLNDGGYLYFKRIINKLISISFIY